MGEFRISDVPEIKRPNVENYKEIKPQSDITKEEAMGFWDRIFSDKKEDSEIKQIVKEYVSDLKQKSEYPETISKNPIEIADLERLPPEKVAEMHEAFEGKKNTLRMQWESENGKPWPVYTEDVYSKSGETVVRRAGDKYDAHHIQPLCLGGKNEVSNITPLSMNNHIEIHSGAGSCTKLVNKIGGK